VCTKIVKTVCHLLFLEHSYELERRICAQYLGQPVGLSVCSIVFFPLRPRLRHYRHLTAHCCNYTNGNLTTDPRGKQTEKSQQYALGYALFGVFFVETVKFIVFLIVKFCSLIINNISAEPTASIFMVPKSTWFRQGAAIKKNNLHETEVLPGSDYEGYCSLGCDAVKSGTNIPMLYRNLLDSIVNTNNGSSRKISYKLMSASICCNTVT